MGECNSILTILKGILKSEHMFRIAHCWTSVLPFLSFSQVSLFPTGPWNLLAPNQSKYSKWSMPHIRFPWEPADCMEPLFLSDATGHFQFPHQRFCFCLLAPALPCKRNTCSLWIWGVHRYLRLKQSILKYAVFLIKV